jgi:hypothetical protein
MHTAFYTTSRLKSFQDLWGFFSPCKADDDCGLTPTEEDNATGRKKDRKDGMILIAE